MQIFAKDYTKDYKLRNCFQNLENEWNNLASLLEDKQKACNSRAEQMNNYNKVYQQVIQWLTAMEKKVEGLGPVALDFDILKRQADEVKTLQNDHRAFAATIDKLINLANAYERLLYGDRRSTPKRSGSSLSSSSCK